jgi:F-type H+-transporting ATPase subunit alpha
MKKVSGTLKLDLAQFRELEAFSQFGSDLDESTKNQLERGKRAVEVLKQPQYSPVKTEDQVVALYALTKGHMDSIALDKIKLFEEGLIEYARKNAKVFYKEVTETKVFTEVGEAELVKVIGEFKSGFSSN